MKRLIAVLSLAVLSLVVLGAGVAYATHSDGNGPKLDKANGTGWIENQQIHVNAKSGPAGENPRGWIWEKTHPATGGKTLLEYKARVVCMTVTSTTTTTGTSNQAVIVGQIVKSKTGQTGFVKVYVEDNGEPGKGTDRVESAVSPAQPDCVTPLPGQLITKGNYIVHDAPPTS